MNNVLALQMLSDDVGGDVEMVKEADTAPTPGDTANDWGGHGRGRSHLSLLLCR